VVEAATPGTRADQRCSVRIRLAMPCAEIEAGSADPDSRGQDSHAAVAETFDELAIRVEDFVVRRCLGCDRYREPSARN